MEFTSALRKAFKKGHRALWAIALILPTFPGDLSADERKPVVDVDIFVSVDCPIANAYAPEINRLHEKYRSEAVRIRLVYPDPSLTEAEVKKHRKNFSLEPDWIVDIDHSLVARARATITPEVAVFDSDGKLRYRGKIDNRFTDYGDKRRAATEHYLEAVLDRLIAGEAVPFHKNKAIGCFIEPLPESD